MIPGYGHKVDDNDLAFAIERFPGIVGWNPKAFYAKGKIHPNVTEFIDKDGSHHAVFHVKPVYYESVDGFVRPLSEITTHHGNRHIVLKDNWAQYVSLRYFIWLNKRQNLIGSLAIDGYVLQPKHYAFATTTDFFPDPSPETTSVDGFWESDSTNRTWASTIALTTATATDNNALGMIVGWRSTGSGTSVFMFLGRAMCGFDTSAIGDTDTITAATLSYNGETVKRDEASNSPDITLYNFTPVSGSNTAMHADDYNDIGTTELATAIGYSSWTISVYNDFTLNASGLANISKTGVSNFGVQNKNYDKSGTVPTRTASTADTQFRGVGAETTGTGSDPKLTVTYTAGGGSSASSSPSTSPSTSVSSSPSTSPSTSASSSPSSSPSPSSSASSSPSTSPSSSPSPSSSTSSSPSTSPSSSPSPSSSASNSPSTSPSPSPSPSSSASNSPSTSPSTSPSSSPSPSSSASDSPSTSPSSSPSTSASSSPSPSSSPSTSPSTSPPGQMYYYDGATWIEVN